MKEIWILKKDSELADGLFLLHGHPLNIKKSCMDLFGFDATTTNFEDREKVPPDEDCIVVCYLRKKEKVQFEEIRKAVKDVKPPRLFFVVDSEVNNEIEAQLKRQRFCPQSHVIKASADKSVIYDEFHNILEEKLKLLFHEVEMKTGTRKVAVFKNQLESLREKLIERKRKTTFQLTDACIRILKT
ncbi:uncharacterized protein LOC134245993 [Saccostrea cucullata]|uniref:uncharacterized protein LOC134245993 n=1 Tax=Saccostrea cuccullata TaxID=36930 RepID=UPI002ED25FAA